MVVQPADQMTTIRRHPAIRKAPQVRLRNKVSLARRFSPRQICQMFLSEAPDSVGNRMLASSGLVQILPKSSLERRNVPHIMLFVETHKRWRPFRPS